MGNDQHNQDPDTGMAEAEQSRRDFFSWATTAGCLAGVGAGGNIGTLCGVAKVKKYHEEMEYAATCLELSQACSYALEKMRRDAKEQGNRERQYRIAAMLADLPKLDLYWHDRMQALQKGFYRNIPADNKMHEPIHNLAHGIGGALFGGVTGILVVDVERGKPETHSSGSHWENQKVTRRGFLKAVTYTGAGMVTAQNLCTNNQRSAIKDVSDAMKAAKERLAKAALSDDELLRLVFGAIEADKVLGREINKIPQNGAGLGIVAGGLLAMVMESSLDAAPSTHVKRQQGGGDTARGR